MVKVKIKMIKIKLNKNGLTLKQLRSIWEGSIHFELAEEMMIGIKASRKTVTDIADSNETVYGVNTGFGLLQVKKSHVLI